MSRSPQAEKLAAEGHKWIIATYDWWGTNTKAHGMYIHGQLYVAVDTKDDKSDSVVSYEEWARKFNNKNYEEKVTEASCRWSEPE